MAFTELRGLLFWHGLAGLRGPVNLLLLKNGDAPFRVESSCSIALVHYTFKHDSESSEGFKKKVISGMCVIITATNSKT